MKKSLPKNFAHYATLSKHDPEESKVSVSEIVKIYDSLE